MTVRAAVGWVIALLVFWVLLVNEISAGQLLMGALLAGAVTFFARTSIGAEPLPPRRLGAAVRLAMLFAYDIVAANVAVARAVLSPRLPIAPRLVRVPLDIGEPKAIALLAAMVTLTPGTVSVGIDATSRTLDVHVLLAADPEAVARDIKSRYEARIREIFQC